MATHKAWHGSTVPREIWKQAVAADPAVDVFQTPEWVDAICATGGYADASRLYETGDGRYLILPMVRRTGLSRVVPVAESLPGMWGTGGVISTGGALRPQDVETVWESLVKEPVARLRVRPENSALDAWTQARLPSAVSMEDQVKSVIDLRGGMDQVWKNMKSSARSRVRKAERSGIEVDVDDTGRFVDIYYDMYLRWTARRARERGLPERLMLLHAKRAEPRKKFHAVARHLGSACRIWVARREGIPVAATITLVHGRNATYWRGCSDKEAAGAANNLIQKCALEYAVELGCTEYNLGWSGSPSLLHYKRTLGAATVSFPIFTWERVPLGRLEHIAEMARRRVLSRKAPAVTAEVAPAESTSELAPAQG